MQLLRNSHKVNVCLPLFQQTARDIESKMRSEARLKLFTLDPDTQVVIITIVIIIFTKPCQKIFKPLENI